MYLIQASPFTKLFLRKYQQQCAENPNFVFESDPKKPFDILIPRTHGAILMQHLKPVHISKLVTPRKPEKTKDGLNFSTDEETVIQWLTGAPSGFSGKVDELRGEETDIYGVVQLGIDLDIGSALADVAGIADGGTEESNKKAAKTFKDLQTDLMEKTKQAIKFAREAADWRVKRAMKITHRNLMKSYETLKTEGKGVYAPSITEAIGAHILDAELKKGAAANKWMVERLDEVMKNTQILSQ